VDSGPGFLPGNHNLLNKDEAEMPQLWQSVRKFQKPTVFEEQTVFDIWSSVH